MNGKGMQFIPLTNIPLPQKFFGDSTAPYANKNISIDEPFMGVKYLMN